MSKDPFESIRQDFVASLPLRAVRLRAILEQEQGLTREAEPMLREQLHQLAGSAAVFGVVAVMEGAQRMGETIRRCSSNGHLRDDERAAVVTDLEVFIHFLEQAEE